MMHGVVADDASNCFLEFLNRAQVLISSFLCLADSLSIDTIVSASRASIVARFV